MKLSWRVDPPLSKRAAAAAEEEKLDLSKLFPLHLFTTWSAEDIEWDIKEHSADKITAYLHLLPRGHKASIEVKISRLEDEVFVTLTWPHHIRIVGQPQALSTLQVGAPGMYQRSFRKRFSDQELMAVKNDIVESIQKLSLGAELPFPESKKYSEDDVKEMFPPEMFKGWEYEIDTYKGSWPDSPVTTDIWAHEPKSDSRFRFRMDENGYVNWINISWVEGALPKDPIEPTSSNFTDVEWNNFVLKSFMIENFGRLDEIRVAIRYIGLFAEGRL